ncbi:hypothetical protein [Pseudonocardia humida]|uniref:SH3 domain-containing protein n=1 Tax=Pseudonocardia humida TaxID=2800819 RepID=A0ABT1ACE6_9PSEU|nr:hypothetical protein [Pseudonocardia humida]MCO1660673.1 hypothetical protein [Pseudonocardia humida]
MGLAAGAAAAAMVLAGLVPAESAPASAAASGGGAGCRVSYEAVETVKVHATGDGIPPENRSELNDGRVIGLLLKGQRACTNRLDGSVLGATYHVGGACSPTTNDQWSVVRFRGAQGWVPTSCGEVSG